jgi:hypothetical protein
MFVLEHARYRHEDPDELVAASLACRYCLRTASEVDVTEDGFGGIARCYCPRCRTSGDVVLDLEQLLRLVLRSPPNVYVSLRSAL